MKRYAQKGVPINLSEETIYVGIDVHKVAWDVTVRTEDVELSVARIPGTWECLEKILTPYRATKGVKAVYEAGFSGFWLYRKITAWGGECLVTPPSHLPQESGNRVKTDRKDSRKLAHLLSKGLLRGIYVPSEEELSHRDVFRRRQGLMADRTRVMNRIRSKLLFLGIGLPEELGDWSKAFLKHLKGLRLTDRWEEEGFARLLEEYTSLSQLIDEQTKLLKELAKTPSYQTNVALLKSFPGMGVTTAMALLLELGDVSRFRQGDQLSAYAGLSPSQYSSGEKVRLGHITGMGKHMLRSLLVELSWRAVSQDSALGDHYRTLCARSGGKRAIVAIARRILQILRRMLLDQKPYDPQKLAQKECA